MKKKYLLLYLKTGAGHFKAANIIAKTLDGSPSRGVKPFLIDGFFRTNQFVRKLIENGYRFLQAKAKWVYSLLYALNKITCIAQFSTFLISIFIKPHLKSLIQQIRPDRILVFHFFLNKPVYDSVAEIKLNIPIITIVTDPFTPALIWFLQKDQNFIVFSKKAKKYSIEQQKIPEKKVHVFPVILDQKFKNNISYEEIMDLKRKYCFPIDKKLLVIIGGGDGIPKGKRLLKVLLKANLDISIAFVCGRDDDLEMTANRLVEKYQTRNIRIFGYIDFVFELISCSDLIITKAGPAIIMETLMLKKIPIVNTYLWEQEKGNVEFIKNKNLGIYEKNLKKIPGLIQNILNNQQKYHFYIKNIHNTPFSIGNEKIIDFINTLEN